MHKGTLRAYSFLLLRSLLGGSGDLVSSYSSDTKRAPKNITLLGGISGYPCLTALVELKGEGLWLMVFV